MGYWSSSRSRETGESDDGEQEYRSSSSDDSEYRTDAYRTTADIETDIVGKLTIAQARERYDRSADDGEIRKLMQMEEKWGPQVHHWIAEGVPTDAMKSRVTRERFRERRDTPIPWNVEKDNEKSLQRSREATEEIEPAGRTSVPDAVREVITSPGRSLDDSIQRAVEERMGDSLGDVRIHTGPRAAAAADAIDARAFTVGNHVAFGADEYDPESAEGQHVLAHELAHVRQQTGGALSMLPQDDVELEIDPDPELEREAEETARRVMSGGDLGIQRLSDTDVHVQRIPADDLFPALAMFEQDVRSGEAGEFQRQQSARKQRWIADDVIGDVIGSFEAESQLQTRDELDADASRFEEQADWPAGTLVSLGYADSESAVDESFRGEQRRRAAVLRNRLEELPDRTELERERTRLERRVDDKLAQVGVTERQRDRLDGGIEFDFLGDAIATSTLTLLSEAMGTGSGFALTLAWNWIENNWGSLDGDIVDRLHEVRQELLGQYASDWSEKSEQINNRDMEDRDSIRHPQSRDS